MRRNQPRPFTNRFYDYSEQEFLLDLYRLDLHLSGRASQKIL
jgi:hypothetical protein